MSADWGDRHSAEFPHSGFVNVTIPAESIIHERFTDHDIRRKIGSDLSLEHASKLLGH